MEIENKKSYLEELQELNGSIKDDTFVECEDIPLENNLYKGSRNIMNLPKHKIEHPSLESINIDRG